MAELYRMPEAGDVIGWCCSGCRQLIGTTKRNVEEATILILKVVPATPCARCERSFEMAWWGITAIAADQGLRVITQEEGKPN